MSRIVVYKKDGKRVVRHVDAADVARRGQGAVQDVIRDLRAGGATDVQEVSGVELEAILVEEMGDILGKAVRSNEVIRTLVAAIARRLGMTSDQLIAAMNAER